MGDEDGDRRDEPGRIQRATGYTVVVLFLIACGMVSAVLLVTPPKWPQDVQGWLVLAAGSALALFTAVTTSKIGPAGLWIARKLTGVSTTFQVTVTRRGVGRLVAGAAVLGVIVLVASVINPPSPAADDLEPGDITIFSAFNKSASDPRTTLVNAWNKLHPNNHVTIKLAPNGTDQQHASLVNDAQPNGPHTADVYLLDNVWMAEFIKNDYIRPLDESRRTSQDSEFLTNVLETCKDTYGHRPGLWGLPLNADAGLLFYRSDLTGGQEPKTWDDYLGTAAAGTETKVKGDAALKGPAAAVQAATANQLPDDDEMLTVTAFEAMWAAGGQVVTGGQPVFNADNSALAFDDQALAGLKNLAAARSNRMITLPGAESTTSDRAITQFEAGRALYVRNWPVTYDQLKRPASGSAIPFGVAASPGPSVLGGQNLAISGTTTKPRAAQALVEFLTNSANELTLFQVGGFAPTRPDAYQDASSVFRPYANALLASVTSARMRPVNPHYTEFSIAFRDGMKAALQNGGTVDDALPRKLAEILNH